MKKMILTIIGIIGFGLAYVHAQDESHESVKLSWGLKAETNMSNFILSGLSGAKSKMNTGATLGGFIGYNVSKHFSLQGEIIYHFKTSDFIYDGQKSAYEYWGMEIPVYAMLRWDFRRGGRFYMGGGPYSEFGFDARLKKAGETTNLYDNAAMNDSNSGFGITAGYEFACGIQINAGYKISITNILDANSSSVTLLPAAVSLGLGYRFGK
jgi:hypothetical protein